MPSDSTVTDASHRVLERAQRLAACSDSEDGLSRLFCSGAMRSAHELVGGWMEGAGMATRVDPGGNLIGRLGPDETDTKCVLIGSHLDTVVNAGRFDGALGVLMGLAIAEMASQEMASEEPGALPFAIDVVAFSEEEGVRYQSPYIGSRAIAGELRAGDPLLERLDDCDVRMADALASFGCDPLRLGEAAYDPRKVIAFLEAHIEQGPVLEIADLPVGVVTGIAGQTRACFRFSGERGHAGTVPMTLRKDPMPAAARFIAAVEEAAKRRAGALATVGRLDVHPNVANVIPAEVAVRVDVRHAEDGEREACFADIDRAAMASAERGGVSCQLEWCEHQAATRCDSECTELLRAAVAGEVVGAFDLMSGAGHDAVVMAPRFPTGLLFLRCKGGLSHHPDESVAAGDVAVGLRVLWRMIQQLAQRESLPEPSVAAPA